MTGRLYPKRRMRYAEVILPLPLENSYTYRIPADLEESVHPGCRVVVHFGKKHYYTAIVLHVTDETPQTDYELKEIFALLDAAPIIRETQLRFWQWLASYYLCKLGDVYKAALPTGLKLESETAVTLNSHYEAAKPLRQNEQLLLDSLGEGKRMTVSELGRCTGIKNILPLLSRLMSDGAIVLNEDLAKGFTPKTVQYVRLSEAYRSEEQLHLALDQLKRARKQADLLTVYLDLSGAANQGTPNECSKKELLEHSGHAAAILDSLVKRGIMEYYEKEVSRLQNYNAVSCRAAATLSDEQNDALRSIKKAFEEKEVCLLDGITSSGKTEIYIRLIEEMLSEGKQVLYLLPEIAITTQMTERLACHFGDKLVVYHSRFSNNERVEIWNKLLHREEPAVVLGIRSSLFLPFSNLGLVIVDEEHDPSYKQHDPAPRYHARNAAIVLGCMHGAKTLLGSATPSIESYYNAHCGKYGLVELKKRYGSTLLPEIIAADVKELRRKRLMKHPLFSPVLIEKIRETLSTETGQVLLFQNRRGFAPIIECKNCGWVPKCLNCDVSLSYHKRHDALACHYCGYTEPMPRACPDCGGELQMLGFGTEKVEEAVKELFPGAPAARLDTDTTRTKNAYERILAAFGSGEIRILIGTQMISKGLDFRNVHVVGILNADSLMNYPDFRAHERAFQLMVQVSGRAGRGDKRGTVVLQSRQTEHPLIQKVLAMDYTSMVREEMTERKAFRYPPYFRLISLVLRSRNEALLNRFAATYAGKLRQSFGSRVLGPVTPPVSRVQTLYIKTILLKLEVNSSVNLVRELLDKAQKEMSLFPDSRQVIVHYDVDPL